MAILKVRPEPTSEVQQMFLQAMRDRGLNPAEAIAASATALFSVLSLLDAFERDHGDAELRRTLIDDVRSVARILLDVADAPTGTWAAKLGVAMDQSQDDYDLRTMVVDRVH